MTYYITAESFGDELPINWKQIAKCLNRLIDEQGIAEDHEAVNELWEDFWHGRIGGIDVYMPGVRF